ncbi:MAG: hypothetical protein M1596_05170, partial [Firmicutes bacterium]|nr:hypothetical protein [Bacillota bacterium]
SRPSQLYRNSAYIRAAFFQSNPLAPLTIKCCPKLDILTAQGILFNPKQNLLPIRIRLQRPQERAVRSKKKHGAFSPHEKLTEGPEDPTT